MPATASGVYPCYENQFTIDGKSIADMESFSVSIDNGVEEWTPFEHEGWIRRLMTSKSMSVSVSGKRNVGDQGNDLIIIPQSCLYRMLSDIKQRIISFIC